MIKSGKVGMWLHQTLSFSQLMMRVPKRTAVFWPGCALMRLEPDILQKTLTVLRRAEPEITLAACCCGQPTRYLFPKQLTARRSRLISLLKMRGVQRIYTACPNCTLQLRELKSFEILPIWPVLAAHIHPEDISPTSGSYIWHDPCPTRSDSEQQHAARKLLTLCGCSCSEPEHNGTRTLCCGNYHMMHTLKPETSTIMRQKRLSEFPEDRIITSSCEGCLGSFRNEGRDVRHLLELLFGKSSSRSWSNRLKTTIRCK